MENARFVGSYICKAKWEYCESSYKYIAGIANETGQSYTKAYTEKHIFFRYTDLLYSFQMFHMDTCIKINHNTVGRYFHGS